MASKLPIKFTPAKLRPRHDGWTAEKQIRFIETLAHSKCVDEACRSVGMSDTSAYALRGKPCGAAFRRAWFAAMDCQMQRVEQSSIERSINGVPRPIFYKGEQVGEWRHYDERLTMFLLRSRRPARYGKWMDRALPADPQEIEDDGIALDGGLDEIECTAPEEDGNPVDWDEPE
ncbi:MAG: hypothetical protein ACJ8FB_05605 [Sphingomicrobium sp.]